MEKDPFLVNIYLKIHNKKNLTMDDLSYLAKYAPECFEKTCRNVVYNIPEVKPVMEAGEKKHTEEKHTEVSALAVRNNEVQSLKMQSNTAQEAEEGQTIEKILENLKRLEEKELLIENVNADEVKNLLGNLYMEMLFPHNGRDTFMKLPGDEGTSFFDKKA